MEKKIIVEVDFQQLEKANPKKLFVLNEQSANFFRKYTDSNNLILTNDEIGAWDYIDAKWAFLMDLNSTVGYKLWRNKKSIFRRGRETMLNRLDWAGLDYQVQPNTKIFKYIIEIFG